MSEIIFAFPSKGRIRQEALDHLGEAFFAASGEGDRHLQIEVEGLAQVQGQLLPSAEIAHRLKLGQIHFGITGEDLVSESSLRWRELVAPLARFPFAQAQLVVGVPCSWVDVHSMADLDDAAITFRKKHGRRMRFATKYPLLTRNFFSAQGLIDYRIVESLGATEAAPANHTAEAICDLTSSGETLKSNGLKMLSDGTIFQSQAALFASRKANWGEGNSQKEIASKLLEKMKIDPAVLQTLWD